MKEYHDRLTQLAQDMDQLYSDPNYSEEELDVLDQIKMKISDTLRNMRELMEPGDIVNK